jgi:chromosome partitioning protein
MLQMTAPQEPHVIVLGNLKGGSGKSTLSMHIAIGLMKAGRQVATLDLDFEQQTLTRFIDNRKRFARERELIFDIPEHRSPEEGPSGAAPHMSDSARMNFLSGSLAATQTHYDFIVIDTPAGSNRTNLFAHALADTIITPINDSFLDLDVIASLREKADGVPASPYAETIRRAREARRLVTSRTTDWLVVRNRISPLDKRNDRALRDAMESAANDGGFRTATGLTERVIYRELFPQGLTAFDSMEASLLGVKPTSSHMLARQEVRQLISMVEVKPAAASDPETADRTVNTQARAA